MDRGVHEEALAVHQANLPGIGVENPERFYPYGSLAPQVLGIVGQRRY